ncbi:MAG: HupE/UreJ family protein [Gammaproteobacteria bacterium]|nr:HupE/UreJ family protein [Gammaproteobacteria bacterium]MDH5801628.1 HupE/UreJ family protein [Gammaproteobacteria bacterium]
MRKATVMKVMLTLLLLLPSLALAHTEDDGNGFISGLLHPIFGYDHLLAMLCVGIVSAQLGGRNIWVIPTQFVAFMVLGGVLGANAVLFPFVEVNIALSVVLLGLAIVFANKNRSVIPIMLFVAFFGTSHGYAHGVEMPGSASPVFYSFGFVVSTSLIHLLGVAIGHFFITSQKLHQGLTYIGATVSAAGVFILYSAMGAA